MCFINMDKPSDIIFFCEGVHNTIRHDNELLPDPETINSIVKDDINFIREAVESMNKKVIFDKEMTGLVGELVELDDNSHDDVEKYINDLD